MFGGLDILDVLALVGTDNGLAEAVPIPADAGMTIACGSSYETANFMSFIASLFDTVPPTRLVA